MFVLKKNLVVLTRYTRDLYKNICVINKLNSLESHQANFSLASVKHFSLGNKTPSLENTTSVSEVAEQEDPNPLPKHLETITKGDKELEYKLKVIMLETEVLRQEGKAVPEEEYMTPEIWEHLLGLHSRSGRMKYLGFIFKTSKTKENRLIKKLEKRKQHEEAVANQEETPKHLPIEEHALNYGLVHNSIFIRFHDTAINNFYNNRLIKAMQFGQKLVIDCGYDQDMTKRENQNTAKQLMLLFAENRNHDDPFDIHYTNMTKESDITKGLHKFIPTMYNMEFPMNIHETSYLDFFPRQKLVYLTPHCREEMTSFDHDAVYIVGAIVDKVNNIPLSLAKAKREGLTMKKFPLDRYLQWGSGSGKSLTINQCVAILLDLKATGDWNYALRHVPKRKLADSFPLPPVATFKPTSNPRSFISPQKRNTWKPNTNKHSRINVRHFYD